jgi:hypothetical protein
MMRSAVVVLWLCALLVVPDALPRWLTIRWSASEDLIMIPAEMPTPGRTIWT